MSDNGKSDISKSDYADFWDILELDKPVTRYEVLMLRNLLLKEIHKKESAKREIINQFAHDQMMRTTRVQVQSMVSPSNKEFIQEMADDLSMKDSGVVDVIVGCYRIWTAENKD